MHCAKGTCDNTWGELRTNDPDSRNRSWAEKDEPEGHFEAGFSSAEDKVRIISESLTLLLSAQRFTPFTFNTSDCGRCPKTTLKYMWSQIRVFYELHPSQGEDKERQRSEGGWKRRGWQWRRLEQTSSPLRTQRQTLPTTGFHCNLVAISRTDTLLQLLLRPVAFSVSSRICCY